MKAVLTKAQREGLLDLYRFPLDIARRWRTATRDALLARGLVRDRSGWGAYELTDAGRDLATRIEVQ